MDIIEIGLDSSSFSPQKKQQLQEFITLFEKLEKYDGMKVSPAAGEGLTSFNAALANTSKLIDEINAKMASMNSVMTSNAAATNNSGVAQDVMSQKVTKLIGLVTQQRKEITALELKLSDLAKQMVSNNNLTDEEVSKKLKSKKVINELASDYDKLTAKMKLQADVYRKSYLEGGQQGKDSKSKEALKDYAATASVVGDVSTKLNQADSSATAMGRSLTKAFSSLRTIAYILPGIGIAGIFNLAFDAIGNVISSLGIFDNALVKAFERETALNKVLSEQFDIFKNITKQKIELYQLTDQNSSGKVGRDNEVLSASGAETGTQLIGKLKQSRLSLSEAAGLVGEDPVQAATRVEKTIQLQIQVNKSIAELERRLAAPRIPFDKKNLLAVGMNAQFFDDLVKGQERKSDDGGKTEYIVNDKFTKAKIEAYKSRLQGEKAANEEELQNLGGFIVAKNKLLELEAQQAKFFADENRRIKVETGKNDANNRIGAEERVFKYEASSQLQREQALSQMRDNKLTLNKLDLYNVTGNNSSTRADIITAQNKKKNDDLKVEREYQEKTLDLKESYRQRMLKADTEIAKDELDKEAVKNEKIYNNVKKSLGERMLAFNKYFAAKAEIEDREYLKERERLSLKANDPTAKKELQELDSKRFRQKANLQADIEKKSFDVISTSLDEQFKAVLDANFLEEKENIKFYTRDLEALNKRFKDKKISAEKFNEERKKLDRQYHITMLDEAIADDNADIKRLEDNLEKQKKVREDAAAELEDAGVNLDYAKSSGGDVLTSQRYVDQAQGKLNASNDAIDKSDKELKTKKDKRSVDENNRAKQTADDLEKTEEDKLKKKKKIAAALLEVEKAFYNAVKEMSEKAYQQNVARLEAENSVRQEQMQKEIDAIDRSSLSAKDKNALVIQLQEQKLEADKRTKAEEKKLAYEEAVFQRDLSIAHIILSTTLAVVEALPDIPKSIAVGAVGAIALAQAIATPIPSYEFGTENHPGGVARYGEAGPELVKEPYKSPYIVLTETVSYLPKGTEIVPMKKSPEFGATAIDTWEQTRYLAKKLMPKDKKIVNNNIIKVDLGFEVYRRNILGN